MSGKVSAILPPSSGKVAPPTFNDEWAFQVNGRSHLMGVPDNRASMSGKVGAICHHPVANYSCHILRRMGVIENWASKLNETKKRKRKQTKPTKTNEN
jgi:hypothetical protein